MIKTYYRKNNVRFVREFKDGSLALAPFSPEYPHYAIFDPSNNAVQEGTATFVSPGSYRVDWYIQPDAPQSSDQTKWRIEWVFLDTNQRQISETEYFEVKDEVYLEETGRDQKFITMIGKPYLCKMVLPVAPFALSLSMKEINNETEICSINTISEFDHRVDGQFHTYSKQVNSITNEGAYLILWEITDQATSTPRNIFQKVETVAIKILAMFPELRMLIDKFQKAAGTVYGYEDSDIHEYIIKGNAMINNAHPMTNWGMYNGSPIWYLWDFWLMAAAFHGLMAQHLCEIDAAFNFSGLSTTLDADRASQIEGAMERMSTYLQTNLPAAKTALYRAVKGNGGLGLRAFGRSPMRWQQTYKMSQASGIVDKLIKLGIISW